MRVMLDTDTCIFAMAKTPGFAPTVPLRECGISTVVLGELELGVRRSVKVKENRSALDHWLATVPVLEVDADVARRYGQLRADLESIGNLIGPNDLWIAAHALSFDAPLISNNLSEFRRVPGLSVETWIRVEGGASTP